MIAQTAIYPTKYLTSENDLSLFQKVLLQANGTVTAMLETYLGEPIQIIKLSENLAKINLNLVKINLDREEEIIVRKVLLQGKVSHRNCIYANSYILINNLEPKFSDQLLNTNKSIGQLWSEQKVETFKEIIDFGKEPANELAQYFGVKPEASLLFRTYSVAVRGKVTMIITEKFPVSYFCES